MVEQQRKRWIYVFEQLDEHKRLKVGHSEVTVAMAREYNLHRQLLYSYAVQSPFSFLIPYCPLNLRPVADRVFWRYRAAHHMHVLLDTVLIMREGGFRKLSSQDIYDYCLKTGNSLFMTKWLSRAKFTKSLPISEAMAKEMAPLLDAYAERLLKRDWTRIPMGNRWCVEQLTRLYGMSLLPIRCFHIVFEPQRKSVS